MAVAAPAGNCNKWTILMSEATGIQWPFGVFKKVASHFKLRRMLLATSARLG